MRGARTIKSLPMGSPGPRGEITKRSLLRFVISPHAILLRTAYEDINWMKGSN